MNEKLSPNIISFGTFWSNFRYFTKFSSFFWKLWKELETQELNIFLKKLMFKKWKFRKKIKF